MGQIQKENTSKECCYKAIKRTKKALGAMKATFADSIGITDNQRSHGTNNRQPEKRSEYQNVVLNDRTLGNAFAVYPFRPRAHLRSYIPM